ncbi:KUP/HAK/KT family potassium transporter [Lactiplantibacillus fabifermentans]|uniref:Probable potassium transport system protein Kup n=2 Tax=Lactiplantibacillus fabifermentans TaxID=483011 RepID=A0A0R2NKH8_9LACO|nr:KUP/HAK/KT family potassium transporter [Lactiplantibacillus fabifermentans]ETY73101.1 potassium transporter Kup [Lactiplantibacillus fabifermentans T30PCM01]KRO25346.1 potassium transport system protein kup 1 [Lactiplantibacillus fabifermentans DSM 21115]
MELQQRIQTRSLFGMLITLGVVYGDIGTSPLYVMNAIINDAGALKQATPDYVIGCVSLIFWTLMLITTVKYVLIALRADNHHEGGIFALYALVRHRAKWLILIALIGGAALLADGTLTPAVTVTSAVEGLRGLPALTSFSNHPLLIPLTVTAILLVLFTIQALGTAKIGKSFGPIMLLWFTAIGLVGAVNIQTAPAILRALSPVYALQVLFSPTNKMGIFILGSVFLATTGAEALYSDMGHVGKANINATWPFVYTTLILNYLGQGAWIITHYQLPAYRNATNLNPFYEMIPASLRVAAIILATLAAIIASQALITGSYTLVDEAIGLKFLPRMTIKHPSNVRSQIYIGAVNWLLCLVTLTIVWLFQTSAHMEAAYGLAITITMLMTTILLTHWVQMKGHRHAAWALLLGFGTLETVFLIASLTKFIHGGYLTLGLTLIIFLIMVTWYFGNRRRIHYNQDVETASLLDYRQQLTQLSHDDRIPLFATNLVYLAKVNQQHRVKRAILYSILDKRPKRAKVYWFITINETNQPYDCNYTVDMLGTRNIVEVQLNLGFKKSQHVTIYLRSIVNYLIDHQIIDPQHPHYGTVKHRQVGDFKFVVQNQQFMDLASYPTMRSLDRLLIGGRVLLQNITPSPAVWYGLEFSDVLEETVPLFTTPATDRTLKNKTVHHQMRPPQA